MKQLFGLFERGQNLLTKKTRNYYVLIIDQTLLNEITPLANALSQGF